MLFQIIKEILYHILVKSHIVWYCMPLVKIYMRWAIEKDYKKEENYIVDDSGQKLKVTTINNKNYAPLGTSSYLKIKKLKIRNDDVMICGYPKTGCHWTFEVLRMILYKTTSVSKYGKSVEGMIELLPEFVLDSMPSPRILNSHLLYDELPQEMKLKKTKIILTTRCPKDVVVSYYNHHRHVRESYGYQGSFNDYFKLFTDGVLAYGSYFNLLADWKRVVASSPPNPIFLVKYEDMKENPTAMIKKLARFLDEDITEEFAQKIVKYTEFKHLKSVFKDDKYFSALYRKGIVGDWKNWMTEDQSAEMDARMNEVMGQ